MVRNTKRCLKKIIGQAKLTCDELLTAVIEVEAIVNSRPLYSSDDLEEPLTPSHLLIGRRALSLPDNLCYNGDKDDDPALSIPALSWTGFGRGGGMSSHLLELRESHRYSSGGYSEKSISIGDIVVVHNDNEPRGFWKLADLIIMGRDGQVQGATLRVHRKDNCSTMLRRPLQHLYPLEVHCTPEPENDLDTGCESGVVGNDPAVVVSAQIESAHNEVQRRSTKLQLSRHVTK
jgi:hypothetical protein